MRRIRVVYWRLVYGQRYNQRTSVERPERVALGSGVGSVGPEGVAPRFGGEQALERRFGRLLWQHSGDGSGARVIDFG
jgi:hypothetical protein